MSASGPKLFSPPEVDEQLLEFLPLSQYLIIGYKYALLFFVHDFSPLHTKEFWERLYKSSLFESPTELAQVPWRKELTHWKRPWSWERLRAGEEGGDRGWDGWMASPNQWSWVWASSGRWWRTGKPGVLQPMGWQRVGHDWATEQNNRYNKVSLGTQLTQLSVQYCTVTGL